MGRFALVGPSYRSQSVLADCQMTMNWYLEQIESGVGRSQFALYPTPGLNALYNLKQAPLGYGQGGYGQGGYGGSVVPLGGGTRGQARLQGRSFAVVGTSLWELLAPNQANNAVNWSIITGVNIASDGLPVSLAVGGHQLLICSAGNAYVFDLAANALTKVDPSAGANLPIAMVAYCFGFFFALVQNQSPVPWQINASAPLDATNWNGLSFAEEVQVFGDNPNCIFSDGDTILWTFSPNGIQPYSNTGNFPFPFDIIPGTLIKNGLAGPFGVAMLDNTPFWVGADKRGAGMVWRMNGFTPQRVSNHAIEYALQSYGSISDVIAVGVQDQGHSFLELHFPSADKTWRYDVATGQWHERGRWNAQAGKFQRSLACFHDFNFGMHLRGDPTTGLIYQESINIYSDNGAPIKRVRRAPHITKEQEWIFLKRLQLDVETGLATFQGNKPASLFNLADVNGVVWQVGVSDVGALTTAKAPAGSKAGQTFLTDQASNTCWQVEVSTLGVLFPVSVPFNILYANTIPMVSASGNQQWLFSVKQVAPGVGQLVTTPQGIVGRGALWTLKISKDGGQTFVDYGAREAGKIGEYTKRLLWNRLGRARDWVIHVEYSDAAPARIIDGYLEGEGFEPASERLTKEIAKRA